MQFEELLKNTSQALSPSDAIVLYLSIVLEQENAQQVLQFLPESEFGVLQQHLESLFQIPLRDSQFFILDEIKNLSRAKKYEGIDDFEGSWLYHAMKEEKPATAALLARFLHRDQREVVSQYLDRKHKHALPSEEDIDRVSPEVVALVRGLFNQSLFQFSAPYAFKDLSIFFLRNLSNRELLVLIEDLGLEMLSLAFQGVAERYVIELVRKLDRKDAEKLYEKFSENSRANRSDIKSAQLEVLNLSRDFSSSRNLILEAGVLKLGRSLVNLPDDFVTMVQYKLPLRSGFQLERYVTDFKRANPPESVTQANQDFIVFRLRELAKQQSITAEVLKLSGEQLAIPPRIKLVKRPLNSVEIKAEKNTEKSPMTIKAKDATAIRGVRL